MQDGVTSELITVFYESEVTTSSQRQDQLLLALVICFQTVVDRLHGLLCRVQFPLNVRQSTLQSCVLREFTILSSSASSASSVNSLKANTEQIQVVEHDNINTRLANWQLQWA